MPDEKSTSAPPTYRPMTSEDGIAHAIKLVNHHLAWLPNCQYLTVEVLYNGMYRSLRLVDHPHRPPHPEGVWFDDLVSAACRYHFGCTRGSARPRQGETKPDGSPVFEFREVWPEPTRLKIHEDVPVAIETSPPAGDVIRVRTAAYAGADQTSVIFASCYQALERRFGAGELAWVTGKDHRLTFRPTPHARVNSLVPCRYQIERAGGQMTELVIYVPSRVTRTWKGLTEAIAKECRLRFGVGMLGYVPELGETTFAWK